MPLFKAPEGDQGKQTSWCAAFSTMITLAFIVTDLFAIFANRRYSSSTAFTQCRQLYVNIIES